MKKTATTALVITLAGLGAAGSVAAAPHRADMPTFEDLDTNGDSVITQAELDAKQAAKFTENDLNGDGFLDTTELLQAAKGRLAKGPRGDADPTAIAAKIITRSDTDGDGRISGDEAKGPLARNFDSADSNGDGFIDADELKAGLVKRAGERGPRKSPEERIAMLIERADTDGDGKLSPTEATPRNAGKIFARMDTDSNGEITRAEWDAAIASRRDNN